MKETLIRAGVSSLVGVVMGLAIGANLRSIAISTGVIVVTVEVIFRWMRWKRK